MAPNASHAGETALFGGRFPKKGIVFLVLISASAAVGFLLTTTRVETLLPVQQDLKKSFTTDPKAEKEVPTEIRNNLERGPASGMRANESRGTSRAREEPFQGPIQEITEIKPRKLPTWNDDATNIEPSTEAMALASAERKALLRKQLQDARARGQMSRQKFKRSRRGGHVAAVSSKETEIEGDTPSTLTGLELQRDVEPPPLPTAYTLLPPLLTDPSITIGGKSYSLDLLDENGHPRTFPNDPRATKAAAALYALLPLPKPILVVGMPKAGTSSIYQFFKKSGSKAVHWTGGYVRPPGTRFGYWTTYDIAKKKIKTGVAGSKIVKIGTCMQRASASGRPLLKSCGGYEVWAQIDVSEPGTLAGCYFPQILNLAEIHQEAPTATFILNRRNFTLWADSTHRWAKNSTGEGIRLDHRLAQCRPFGPKSSQQEDLILWHQQQIQRVRQFVIDHPSHALLEVDIQEADAGPRMAKSFRISHRYWRRANANTIEESELV